jgi:hypothetical protein
MNRILGIASAMLLVLIVLVPVAAAAEPWGDVQHILVSTQGDVSLPSGQHVDLLVVIDGAATIAGDADGVVVVNGSADFVGAHTNGVVAVNSSVSLDSGTIVSGEVRAVGSTVARASGSIVDGGVLTGVDGVDWAGTALVFGSLAALLSIGLYIAAVAAGLAVAGLAPRQVRSAGSPIGQELGMTILAGFGGVAAIIATGLVAMVTIVGIPLGLAILLMVLPATAFAGFVVAAVWLGERILERLTPVVPRERPYLAVVIGTTILSVLSIVPFVGGAIVFLGFGAVILSAWRTFRGRTVAPSVGAPGAASVAG